MRKLLIEYKKNKPKEWVEMFALLDYIRDMELTFVCEDTINGMHRMHDDEGNIMISSCDCIHAIRKRLIRRAWIKLRKLYNTETTTHLIHLKFWLNDYLMLDHHKTKYGSSIYSKVYDVLT